MEVRLAPAGIELHSSVNRYSLWYRTLRHLLVLQMLPINYDKTIDWDVVVMTIRVMIIIMHNLQAVPTPVLVLIPAGLMTGGISPGHLALLGTTQQMDSKYTIQFRHNVSFSPGPASNPIKSPLYWSWCPRPVGRMWLARKVTVQVG